MDNGNILIIVFMIVTIFINLLVDIVRAVYSFSQSNLDDVSDRLTDMRKTVSSRFFRSSSITESTTTVISPMVECGGEQIVELSRNVNDDDSQDKANI